VHPVRLRNGRYVAPTDAGYSGEIKPGSLARYAYPAGRAWAEHPMPEGTEVGT